MPLYLKSPTTLGIYGKSGMGKTYQLVEIVKYLLKRWGWKPGDPPIIRLGTWDSTLDPFEGFMRDGSVDAINLNMIKDGEGNVVIAQTLNSIAKGSWIMKVREREDGGGAGPLYVWLGKGGPVATTFPKFKNPTKYPNEVWPSGLPQDNGIRAYLFEGISEMAFELLNEHGIKARGIRDDKADNMGKYAAEKLTDSDLIEGLDKDLRSGSPSRNHYGDVGLQVLVNFLKQGIFTLPVDLVAITMHEDKGTDEVTGSTALGPSMPGQKAISQVTQKASHFVHLSVEDLKEGTKRYVAHTQNHSGDGTLSMQKWPAKVTMNATQTAAWLKKYKGGVIPLELNPTGTTGTVADILEMVWPPEASKGPT